MHADARAEWERLLAGHETLHTTNYVLVEVSALLQSRIGMDAVRSLAADIVPAIDIIWIDEGMHRSAYHALLVASRRNLSLVDCASFEVMRRPGIERAFCFDLRFSERGFLALPPANG